MSGVLQRARALYGRTFFLDLFLAFSLTVLAGEVYKQYSPWGLAFNKTASIPRGLYITTPLAAGVAPQLGQIACFRYTEPMHLSGRDYFPRGSSLCKPVAALAGDSLVQRDGVLYRVTPGSADVKLADVASNDSKGRPMPVMFSEKPRLLERGEYALVAGAKPNSLDTRFLGVFKREQLFQTVRPLITFD